MQLKRDGKHDKVVTRKIDGSEKYGKLKDDEKNELVKILKWISESNNHRN